MDNLNELQNVTKGKWLAIQRWWHEEKNGVESIYMELG